MLGTIERLVEDVPAGLAEARASVVAMLDAYERETSTPSDRIVLGGFSQGSMLALDVALHTERALAGLVVLSGTLIASNEWLPLMAARKDLPVFQSHGTSDPILPFPDRRAPSSRARGRGDARELHLVRRRTRHPARR